ncbi:MAG: hypothetical protein Q7S70_02395 [bacterium]|nr:hypothetical protein [bacterium]
MNLNLFKKIATRPSAELFLALILFSAGISLRFLPHAPNFSPLSAIALFGGTYFSKRKALVLPMTIMIVSDMLLGFYEIKLMAAVYGSLLLSVVLGFWLKNNKKWYWVAGSAALSATLFFLITNFAVWAFTPWYPKTFSGLLQSYLMALPFFKNNLLGNLFFASCFFGAYETIKVLLKTQQCAPLRSKNS